VALAFLTAPAGGGAQDAMGGQVVGFQDAQGKTVFLHDFKGRPVIINLWATWCAPCVEEMPSLAKLQQDYAAKGLAVIAISEDASMDAELNFYKNHGLTGLTPYFDKGHAVYVALDTHGLPSTVLVNSRGQMIQRVEGPVDWQAPQVKVIIDGLVK
jgi:thiol-disulfide isomerase/thioredoxin